MSSRTEASRSGWRWALVATLALAAALRLAGLGSGLWYDEIVTLVNSARLPLWRIATEFPGVNAHPLYSVLAHASLTTFGDSAWALRLPAALFGVVTVGITYVLGARLTSRGEAWAGATVLAVSYHHVWFSQNARGYTLLGALTLLTTLLLVRALDARRPADLVWYALAATAGVYTHLTMAFVVAGQVAVVVGGRALRWRPVASQALVPLLWTWAAAAILSALLYLPFLGGLLAELHAQAPEQAAQVATARWALAEAVRQLLSGAGVAAAAAGGLLAAAGAVSLYRRQPLGVALLVAPGIVTVVALAALGHPLRPRFVFFLAGGAAIFAGRGLGLVAGALASFMRPLAPAAVLAALTVSVAAASAGALPRNYRVPKQDFAGAVRYLDGRSAAGARVRAAGPACFPIERYFDRAEWRCLETIADWRAATATPMPEPLLVVHTLTDYVDDPELGRQLRTNCPEVARFPGTLGGGDVIVCAPDLTGPAGLAGAAHP